MAVKAWNTEGRHVSINPLTLTNLPSRSAVLEDGDRAVVAEATGVVAYARGMTQLARDTGLAREGLYRALNREGNPEFATIMKVLGALGIRLRATKAA